MSEEKSEEATGQKLKQAKDKGQVFKSLDVLSIGSSIVLIITIVFFFNKIGNLTAVFMRKAFVLAGERNIRKVFDILPEFFEVYIYSFMPVAFTAIVMTTVLTLLQNRGVFSFEPIKPNIGKLNPIKGFKKMFSLKSLYELVKGIIRICIVAYIIYAMIYEELIYLPSAVGISLSDSLYSYKELLVRTVIFVMLAMIPLSLIDFFFQRWSFSKEMRMTKKEVKDEYKKQEGDPEIKSKRRKIQKELRDKSGSLVKVASADIVITNPTYIAIAIRYDEKNMVAPKVVAKGKGKLAYKIRQLAVESSVVIKCDIPLARKLYKNIDINNEITPEFYDDIAELYRWFYKSK